MLQLFHNVVSLPLEQLPCCFFANCVYIYIYLHGPYSKLISKVFNPQHFLILHAQYLYLQFNVQIVKLKVLKHCELFIQVSIGLWAGLVIYFDTEYYIVNVFISFSLPAMYGIIVVNLSMLSTIVTGLDVDAKGPISDMLVKLLDFGVIMLKKILFLSKQVPNLRMEERDQ